MDSAIVVAHYKENVESWLGDFWGHVVLFNKDEPVEMDRNCGKQFSLPNVGREAHTYLHYIINRYNHLPDQMVFVQGDVFEHIDYKRDYKHLVRYATGKKKLNGFEAFGYAKGFAEVQTFEEYFKYAFFSERREVNTENSVEKKYRLTSFSKTEYNLCDCELIYDDELKSKHIYPTHMECIFGATFGVTRDRIHEKPLSYYRDIMKLVDWHNSPLGAHFLERAWPFILGEPLPFELFEFKT